MVTMKRLLLAVGLLVAIGLPRAAIAMSLQEEIDLGRKIDAQIMKDNRLYTDDKAQKEIDEYGQKLAKYVSRPQIRYHFKILKDEELNAFSIPGGYVYFTSRLWGVLRKDEQIGVVAHEIMHIDRRHGIDAMSKQQTRRTILAVLLAATKAGNIWGDVAGVAEQMYSLKYSRGDEQQADFGAVDFCQKTGYNPAGILLAMYKIQRFENEAGGAPPKIFSDHPPTKERLDYLKQLLARKGVPVPAENVQTAVTPNRIGDVISSSGNTMTFTSTKPLKTGDIVWVMREGWDTRYEKRTGVPSARGVVTATGTSVTAQVSLIPSTKKAQVTKGMGVYAPPLPTPEKGVGKIASSSLQEAVGRMQFAAKPAMLDRLFAVQPVWNSENTQLVNENVGYLIVTSPASESGYVGVQQSKYSYAPMAANSVLVSVQDPDQARWIGPVISIGRGSASIEVSTTAKLDKSKTYDVLYPAWSKDDTYAKRVVGTARFDSADRKIVLKIAQFAAGYGIDAVRIGFDVYEQKK